MNLLPDEGSFRDPDGRVLHDGDKIYRSVSPGYKETWRSFAASPVCSALRDAGKLIGFSTEYIEDPLHGELIQVDKIPFVSYPCEWSPLQLRQAALLTLDIQLRAIDAGFSLKDASAYNVQFRAHNAVFIDLFSFEPYEGNSPWIAYGQFCRHFLAPLLLAHYKVITDNKWLVSYPDGVPLALCSRLLPARSRFSLLAATHIHLHAKFEKKYAGSRPGAAGKTKMPVTRLKTMLQHMRDAIASLNLDAASSNWTGYYQEFSYTDDAFRTKLDFAGSVARQVQPPRCLDLGCNTGEFSAVAAQFSRLVVACDQDVSVICALHQKKNDRILPLHIDLSNPTPWFGWAGTERTSFLSRVAGADLVLALALVHHLCIGNNVPLRHLAGFFSSFKGHLVIEFVPKDDPQAQRLLVSRRDIFAEYTLEHFRNAFAEYFIVLKEVAVPGSDRILFHMQRISS